MEALTRYVLSALVIISSSALAQESQPAPTTGQAQTHPGQTPGQETPSPQTNPATQSNLPNAPSSVITGKPHGQGKVPLEDVPHPPVEFKRIPLNVIGDTYRMFTSPIYVRAGDLKWMLPLATAAGVSLSQDSHVARDIVSHNPGFNNSADNVSYDLMYSYIAGSATMYGVGGFSHNDHLRENGLLSAEAQVDAKIFETVVKLGSYRERPTVDNYAGKFYQLSAGTDSSFISGHAVDVWSAAAVIAAEYPSPWVQIGVYSGATATALTRVLAEQHFPTDVLLGSAAGWMIGHYVVRAHHRHPIYRHQHWTRGF
jgi:membrane-associated phospholipid phosphatase